MVIQAFKFNNDSLAAPSVFSFFDEDGIKYRFYYRHGFFELFKISPEGSTERIIDGHLDIPNKELDGFMNKEDMLSLLAQLDINILIRSEIDNNQEQFISLNNRMKDFEFKESNYLNKKQPVILRIDGKAFHTFTKRLDKPFDNDLSEAFQYTCDKLKLELQGVKLIYSQSDEISILLSDWDEDNTQSWFNYRLQKMVSVAASLTTLFFNEYIDTICEKYCDLAQKYAYSNTALCNEYLNKRIIWSSKKYKACFDCRAFSIPEFEISNYFIYRYRDAITNSISALAQAHFSHKQLNGKSSEEMIAMLKEEKNEDYEAKSILQKCGFCIYKNENKEWIKDLNMPNIIEHREYIENTYKPVPKFEKYSIINIRKYG